GPRLEPDVRVSLLDGEKRYSWMMVSPLIAALVSALAVSSVSPPQSQSGTHPKIVALGDSLTSGAGVPADSAWPSLIQDRLNQADMNYTIVNAGASGDT